MTWHYLPELPKPNVDVLIELNKDAGFQFSNYAVAWNMGNYDGRQQYCWYIHQPFQDERFNNDSYRELYKGYIERWAYIEDE